MLRRINVHERWKYLHSQDKATKPDLRSYDTLKFMAHCVVLDPKLRCPKFRSAHIFDDTMANNYFDPKKVRTNFLDCNAMKFEDAYGVTHQI